MKHDIATARLAPSGLLSSIAPNKVFIGVVLGSLAGLAYALIIPIVLKSVQQSPLAHNIQHMFDPAGEGGHFHLFGYIDISTPKLALAFLVTCIVILVCRGASNALLARVGIDATVHLRKQLYQRIAALPIQELERIGTARLWAALNNDVSQVVRGAAAYPALFASITTLVGLLGFLIYLNLDMFVFTMVVIIIGAVTYQIPIYLGRQSMATARALLDRIQEGMRGLIYGAKELKLNQLRRQQFMQENLADVEREFGIAQKRGDTLVLFGMTYGDLISFFAIGVVTYALANYYTMSREDLVGVVMVMLYITAPIATLINAANPIAQAAVASRKLQALFDEMPIEPARQQSAVRECQELKLEKVTFKYDERTRFRVGPIDLSLRRGEVTFVVGGNGSGKTTLGKLLSLHYLPESGTLRFDDEPVTDANREDCRQSVSAIYSDFHLFTRLLGVARDDLEAVAQRYLRDLELHEVVSLENGTFSSTRLSDGQKKRLALLVTFLEDRAIFVFDEWAADQDPTFKNIFYHQLLPSLRQANKLVVVITHDDRYFNLADRVLRMENGSICSDERLHEGAPRAEVLSSREGPMRIAAAPR